MRISSTMAPAAVLAVVTTLVATVTPGAQAETWRDRDDLQDVTSFHHDHLPAPCGTDSVGIDASDRVRDVRRLRVDHGTEAVRIQLSMREVRRRDTDTFYAFYLSVPAGTYFVSVGRPAPRRPLAGLFGQNPHIVESPSNDGCTSSFLVSKHRECDGLTTTDARHEAVVVTVPRACLKYPRWVKVGAQVAGGFTATANGSHTEHVDRWEPPGQHVNGAIPPFGPKVHSSAA